jgi:hypothetical protein
MGHKRPKHHDQPADKLTAVFNSERILAHPENAAFTKGDHGRSFRRFEPFLRVP